MDETQAATWAVGQLRHLYKQMVAGGVRDTAEAARGLLGPAIEKLEPLTTPSESAPQPTPETRVDLEALEKLFDATKDPWAHLRERLQAALSAAGDGRWYDMEKLLREVSVLFAGAPVLLREQAAALARRAAPTGQQQEAGARATDVDALNRACIEGQARENRLALVLKALLEYAEWLEKSLGRMPSLSVMAARGELGLDPDGRSYSVKPPARPPEPAAAPPSAPQEGLFKGFKDAALKAADDAFGSVTRDEYVMYGPRAYMLALKDAIRALPLPEGALTKAAPPAEVLTTIEREAQTFSAIEKPTEWDRGYIRGLENARMFLTGDAHWRAAAPLTQPAVPEKEVVPPARTGAVRGPEATPGVTLKEGVAPARDCLVCPNRAVRGLDFKDGALWCWRHGPFYDSDLFFPQRVAAPAPVETQEGEAHEKGK